MISHTDSKNIETQQANTPDALPNAKLQRSSVVNNDDDFTIVSRNKQHKQKSYRYHVRNIDPDISEIEFKNSLCEGPLSVINMKMFDIGKNGYKSAKIIISSEDSFKVENAQFWPKPMKCRKWLSNREWYADDYDDNYGNHNIVGKSENHEVD